MCKQTQARMRRTHEYTHGFVRAVVLYCVPSHAKCHATSGQAHNGAGSTCILMLPLIILSSSTCYSAGVLKNARLYCTSSRGTPLASVGDYWEPLQQLLAGRLPASNSRHVPTAKLHLRRPQNHCQALSCPEIQWLHIHRAVRRQQDESWMRQ